MPALSITTLHTLSSFHLIEQRAKFSVQLVMCHGVYMAARVTVQIKNARLDMWVHLSDLRSSQISQTESAARYLCDEQDLRNFSKLQTSTYSDL